LNEVAGIDAMNHFVLFLLYDAGKFCSESLT